MERPSFKKASAATLDERLEEFFIRQFGYAAPIRDDPAGQPGAARYWRMVCPRPDARPFAVAYQAGLVKMSRQDVARLYGERVVPHRDGRPGGRAPALYAFTDGARFVFFSADPARNRDDRFDLSEETWAFEGVRAQVSALRYGNLIFRRGRGRLTPQVEFLFDSSHLSADGQFRRYVRAARRALMQEIVADEGALAALLYQLLETPAARAGRAATLYADKKSARARGDRYALKQPLGRLHLELKARLGDALAAVADALLLRYVVARFLEAYYPEAARRAAECVRAAQLDQAELALARLFTRAPGGDFHLADLHEAARALETALPARRQFQCDDFRQFRYEDLRPKTLQDCYEDSLAHVARVAYDADAGRLRVEVGACNRRRKELGAYYTNERLCRFMVERTVKPIFKERLERLRAAAERGDAAEARAAFEAVMNFSVCDPTMGSAPFLRSAFDYLVESTNYARLRRHVAALKRRHPALHDEIVAEYNFLGARAGRSRAGGIGGWEWHVLRRVLYGVDVDLKAVRVACQTFALAPLCHLKHAERFPSYFNVNLKHGNALISPTRPSDRARLAAEHGAQLAELIRLRRRAQSLPNTEAAYAELVELCRAAERVRRPVLTKLVAERVRPVLKECTDELRPFSWELEFPEVFFHADGMAKASAGFDVVLGNPPWEAIKFNDNEFLRSINDDGQPRSINNGSPRPTAAGDSARVPALCAGSDALARAYEHYRELIARWQAWVKAGGQYEHQRGGRDRNKWRLATEVAWKLTRPRGALSLVVPGGIIADEGGYALKRWLLAEGAAHTFVSFAEANDVFPGAQAFTVIGFRKGRATRAVRHLEGLDSGAQLASPPYAPSALALATVEKMSPDALAIPCVRDELDASILEKLYRHPLIVDASAAWHARTVSYDYHMGNDRRFFDAGGRVPLLEGKSVGQYEVAALGDVSKRVPARRQCEPGGQYRVACADVAGTLLQRRMSCCVLPHGYATGDHLNCLLVAGGDAERLFLVGHLNSLVVEWRIRQLARSNHVKKFVLAQLPAPRPPRADVERVAALVAALVTTDARFGDLRPHLNGTPPAVCAAARRDLKCRVDAEVARLFGLTGRELERVLAAFAKVPAATKDLVRAHFKKN
ncbi:MAG TPA: hypothetical protein VF546_23015 [Pyrinomonadaceae bacterium]|jgi:hypothetical protein